MKTAGAGLLPLLALLPYVGAALLARPPVTTGSQGAVELSGLKQAKSPLTNQSVAEFVHGLEASVRRVLGHLRADRSLRGEEAKERDQVAGLMEGALSSQGGVFLHAMALHRALWAAQGLLRRRTQELSQQQANLTSAIQEQQARILYKMLKQRRRLGMKSQVVLLNRKQFENCTYAQELLHRHRAAPALYKQLEELLPTPLLHELTGSEEKHPQEHLAAGGSDGRVHIISSRLKNSVKKMEGELRRARGQISELLARGGLKSETEKKKAMGVVKDLDAVLEKAGKTNDLKSQLEAMYDVEKNLGKWLMA